MSAAGAREIEVVEVLGFGRSGSTLLDRLLGDALAAPAMGELVAVWRRGLLEDRHCSCGLRFAQCPFWVAVVATDPATLTRHRAAGVVLDTNRVMRVWSPLRVRSAAARRALVDAVPAPWFDAMAALYRGVAEVSGATVIVDSSKAPLLAFLLDRIPGVRVHPVPLVRDPRAVAWAWGHPGAPVALAPPLPQLSPARAAVVWTLVNGATRTVADVLGRGAATVRYEDLVDAPEATVARIVQQLGVRRDTTNRGAGAAPVVAGRHTMSGNPRLRFDRGAVVVRADRRWEHDTAPATWAAVTALTLPGLVRYGYPVRPPGAPGDLAAVDRAGADPAAVDPAAAGGGPGASGHVGPPDSALVDVGEPLR